MKTRLFLFLCCAWLIGLQTSSVQAAAGRIKYNFNSSWLLCIGDPEHAETVGYDDASWQPVTLPHAFNEDEAFKVSIERLTTGIVWYRKHFKLPSNLKGQKVFLEFEGIRQGGDIYVNGQAVGFHENGVMAFGFDITPYIRFGSKDNVIAVRIDNDWGYAERETGQKYQWSDRNFNANYGGIPKNVYLHTAGKLYQTLPLYSNLGTTGVYVYAQNINISNQSANIVAESEVRNEYEDIRIFQYQVDIRDMEGKTVKSFSGIQKTIYPGETVTVRATAKVDGLHFWSWGYGYLYDVETRLLVNGKTVDAVVTRTGFRKTAFRNGMVYLNDRVIQIKGYAQRTSNEWPAVGMSVPAWISDFSNRMMVESNGNTVRWMHVTPWKQDVESCDRMGLIQAMPAGDSESDVQGRRWEQRKMLMRDAIIYNRNNPSILFYECGNENISEQHMQEMKDIRNKYDPYGGRAIGSREMLDSRAAEYGGEMLYINKSARNPFWAMEYSRDEGLRKYWDEYTYPFHKEGEGAGQGAAYNHNQDAHAIENVVRWFDYWRERPGTGTRVSSGGVNIIFSDSNTHHRGVENYRRSGEVDPMRLPKDAFWAHYVMWDGWVDVENYHTHIIGHWNYTPDVTKNIYVVSSGDKVELFVNGKSQGFGKQSSRFLYTFENITWAEGELKAVSYNASDSIMSEDLIRTAGKPAAIRLTLRTSPLGFKADGADFALIDVEVVDEQGHRCPTSNQLIHFELNGPAEWRGGIAQGEDNFILSKDLPVECGVNRVIVRATTSAGKITLKATAEGIAPAEIVWNAAPYKVVNGLSAELPGVGLPSNLDRGPTPATPSYTVSRTALEIRGATAAANQQQAGASFDDNEMTSWSNDGRLSTGRITYHLSRRAEIQEIVMKLSGWRTRRYPIIIQVDGQTVYEGNTPQSLGYITIPVKPTVGSHITVMLIGSSTTEDAYQDITEVSGKTESDGAPRGQSARGELRIVEIEVYGKKS